MTTITTKNGIAVTILKTSPKGAALIQVPANALPHTDACLGNPVEVWIPPRAAKSLTERGNLTPGARKALRISKEMGGNRPAGKKAFNRVKPSEVRDISEKAILVICFDGSQDVLPKSQVRIDPVRGDRLYVPSWLASRKNLQFSGKIYWLNEDGMHVPA